MMTTTKCPGKIDEGKPRWDAIPWDAVSHVVAVRTEGLEKYRDPDNWKSVPGWRGRYFAAALRHMMAWHLGQRLDDESGLPHLAHAVINLLFMISLDEGGEQ